MPVNPSHIPTTVVDKNGRVTTVHKRPDTASALKDSSVPPPALKVDKTKLIDDITSALAASSSRRVPEEVDRLRDNLNNYSVSTLQSIAARIANNSRNSLTFHEMKEASSEDAVIDLMHFMPNDALDGYFLDRLQALHEYPQLPRLANYASAPEDVREKCEAILVVSSALDRLQDVSSTQTIVWVGEDTLPVIADDRITEYVLDNPEKAHMMADLINERKIGEYEHLMEIMDGSETALANGSL